MEKQGKKERPALANYFIMKGEVYRKKGHSLYDYGELVPVEERETNFKWKGAGIPMFIHRQIISFFQAGYKKTDSENLIWLYYDVDTGEWMAWAPPQNCVGMTVQCDEKSKEFKEQRAEIPERFVQLGTYHHHCGGSAFASGTDNHDEIDREGVHITIGGIGQESKELSIDIRACFEGTKFQTDISDWIECPPWILEAPAQMQWLIYDRLLKMPHADEDFPEQWLENAKKKYGGYQGVTPRTGVIQQGFPQWSQQTPTTNTGNSSTADNRTKKNLDEIEDPFEKAFAFVENEGLEADVPPDSFDKRDIKLILTALLECGIDGSDAEDFMDADKESLTPNEAASYEIFTNVMKQSYGLHPGRIIWLFNRHNITEYYDALVELNTTVDV